MPLATVYARSRRVSWPRNWRDLVRVRKQPVPEFIVRELWLQRWLGLGLFYILLLVSLGSMVYGVLTESISSGMMRFVAFGLPVLSCVMFLVLHVLAGWARRIVRDQVSMLAQHDHALCIACGFPLVGLPERHSCPECGMAFDVSEVRMRWLKFAQL